MTKSIDSYKYLSGITRRMVRNWINLEKPRPIPWTPLAKPLPECKVALLSSAGIALNNDTPFDQESERRNPWWGDPSFRTLPSTATQKDVSIYHLHIDTSAIEQDLNVAMPLQRLAELEHSGEIGCSAETHYSIMGYILQPEEQLQKTVPAIIQRLKADSVDVLLLAPA